MKCNKKKTNEGETVKDINMSHNNSLLVCAKKQPVHFQLVATAMIRVFHLKQNAAIAVIMVPYLKQKNHQNVPGFFTTCTL